MGATKFFDVLSCACAAWRTGTDTITDSKAKAATVKSIYFFMAERSFPYSLNCEQDVTSSRQTQDPLFALISFDLLLMNLNMSISSLFVFVLLILNLN